MWYAIRSRDDLYYYDIEKDDWFGFLYPCCLYSEEVAKLVVGRFDLEAVEVVCFEIREVK